MLSGEVRLAVVVNGSRRTEATASPRIEIGRPSIRHRFDSDRRSGDTLACGWGTPRQQPPAAVFTRRRSLLEMYLHFLHEYRESRLFSRYGDESVDPNWYGDTFCTSGQLGIATPSLTDSRRVVPRFGVGSRVASLPVRLVEVLTSFRPRTPRRDTARPPYAGFPFRARHRGTCPAVATGVDSLSRTGILRKFRSILRKRSYLRVRVTPTASVASTAIIPIVTPNPGTPSSAADIVTVTDSFASLETDPVVTVSDS